MIKCFVPQLKGHMRPAVGKLSMADLAWRACLISSILGLDLPRISAVWANGHMDFASDRDLSSKGKVEVEEELPSQ